MASAAPVLSAPPVPLLPTRYRVTQVRTETPDTTTLRFVAIDDALPPAAPGQFSMLWMPGVGEAAISHARCLDNGQVEMTIRAVGGVTDAVTAAMPGTTIGLRGPFGTSWPIEQAVGKDLVIVAGGLGLAPVRPVIEAVLADRDRFGTVTLLVGARSPADLLFRDALLSWAGRPDFEVEVTVDQADPSWGGTVGVVTRFIRPLALNPARTVAMVCGPEIMMRYTIRALTDRGIASEQVFVSLERTMRCGVGTCGHCQLGPLFVCRDGPVVTADVALPLMEVRER